MGNEEQETIESIGKKIDRAEGAFIATGRLGVVIITIVSGIAFYAFDKIESNSIRLTTSEKEIAVINAKEAINQRWRDKLERVLYKK